MSPAPKTTLSSLQGVEERLRRLYGTAGSFGVEWKPEITLSVNAGDLTGPGSNSYRGRRVVYAAKGAVGAAQQQAIAFQAPTVVTKIWWSGPVQVATPISLAVIGPSDAGYIPTAFRGVLFSEFFEPNVQSAYAPMFTSAFVAASGAGVDVFTANIITTTRQEWNCELFFPGQLPNLIPGNYYEMVFRTGGAGTVDWGFSGYLY